MLVQPYLFFGGRCEEAVEFGAPAGKLFDGVRAMQLFDTKRSCHGSLLGSNTEGSRNSCSRRG